MLNPGAPPGFRVRLHHPPPSSTISYRPLPHSPPLSALYSYLVQRLLQISNEILVVLDTH